MADAYKNIPGTMQSDFRVGGPIGQSLVDRAILVEGGFNGDSPPAAASYAGQAYVCHTTGGSYTQGQVYKSDGSSWIDVAAAKGTALAIKAGVTISGSVSFVANGLYFNEGSAASPSWVMKGDGSGTSTGVPKVIKLSTTTASSVASSTALGNGSKVTRVRFKVTTAYSAGATIQVAIGATTVMTTSQNVPQAVAGTEFEVEPNADIATGAVVTVTVGGTPGAGAGEVILEYVDSALA